jgi:hypothetical protein
VSDDLMARMRAAYARCTRQLSGVAMVTMASQIEALTATGIDLDRAPDVYGGGLVRHQQLTGLRSVWPTREPRQPTADEVAAIDEPFQLHLPYPAAALNEATVALAERDRVRSSAAGAILGREPARIARSPWPPLPSTGPPRM